MIPKKVFFTKGVGVHREKLASFETALRQAGIEKCNLVSVSSILPPHVKIISKSKLSPTPTKSRFRDFLLPGSLPINLPKK